jgi:predicted GIY-YIG superfamily endonuclease
MIYVMLPLRGLPSLWLLASIGYPLGIMQTQFKREPAWPLANRAREGKSIIRNWTIYAIRFTDGTYYVGITSYRDFMRRIEQHGSLEGARWARGKTVAEILEIHPLGRMSRTDAEIIENDFTIDFRKRYGWKVRGGYNLLLKPSLIPNYTPGSTASLLLILFALVVALAFLVLIASV